MITHITRYETLRSEISILESRIEPHDCGHLYTTIATLRHRCQELESEMCDRDLVFIKTKWGADA